VLQAVQRTSQLGVRGSASWGQATRQAPLADQLPRPEQGRNRYAGYGPQRLVEIDTVDLVLRIDKMPENVLSVPPAADLSLGA